MAQPFFKRLREYYLNVAKVLRGEASTASIFPNTTDIGMSRERVYAEFLRQHAPSKCNVFFGGYLFGDDGSESKQLDVIVTTDTTPNFNFHNQDGHGKSFSPVEGTLCIASIKSTLNKNELFEALDGIASIPPTTPLSGRVTPLISITDYEDWPYKILYATQGVSYSVLGNHLIDYYRSNPTIPIHRRPNIIHVSGQYIIIRPAPGLKTFDYDTKIQEELTSGFLILTKNPDIGAITLILDSIQGRATASTHILHSYKNIFNSLNEIPPEE